MVLLVSEMDQHSYYFDNAGAAFYTSAQLRAYTDDLVKNCYANPHSASVPSQNTTDAIASVRRRLLRWFNTTEDQHSLIFTSGATASLRLVAECFDFGSTGRFIYLEDNHTSVVGMREIVTERGLEFCCVADLFNLKEIPVTDFPSRDLVAYPAQSNFDGRRYSLRINRTATSVLLDAASFVSTAPLDLSKTDADFVAMSFYKIFGFPTGLGALIVCNEASPLLKKTYFGGGSVRVSTTRARFHIPRDDLASRFEDGTAPFLEIIALRHGMDALTGKSDISPMTVMSRISERLYDLSARLYTQLDSLRHHNKQKLVEIYCSTAFESSDLQGPIVTFNVRRADGSYVGFAEVENLAKTRGISLRTGCFCNVGACSRYLSLTDDDIRQNFMEGRECGDHTDLIGGRPTGAVRVSLGRHSTRDEVEYLVAFVRHAFLDRPTSPAGGAENSSGNSKPNAPILTSNMASLQINTFSNTTNNSNDSVGGKAAVNNVGNPPSTLGNPPEEITLMEIIVYPVKSCGGMHVKEWPLTKRGLLYDHNWLIVDGAGTNMRMNKHPRLALIRPQIDLRRRLLVLAADGHDKTVEVPLDLTAACEETSRLCAKSGAAATLSVCGGKVAMFDCGDAVGAWLDAILDTTGCRLKQHSPTDGRIAKDKHTVEKNSSLALVSKAQFLVCSLASARYLRDTIRSEDPTSDLGETEIVHRMRANLVVDGAALSAWDEEHVDCFRLGSGVELRACLYCKRCDFICVDTTNGDNSSSEPLRCLVAIRETVCFWRRATRVPGFKIISAQPDINLIIVAASVSKLLSRSLLAGINVGLCFSIEKHAEEVHFWHSVYTFVSIYLAVTTGSLLVKFCKGCVRAA